MTPLNVVRRRNLLTMRQLAERAGVALSTIYLIESGRTAKPRPKVAQAISDALGVRVGQIDEFRSAARKRKAPAVQNDQGQRPNAISRHTTTQEPQ